MTTRNAATLNLEQVRAAWYGLAQYVPLGPMLTEADYTQRVRILESVLEAIGTNEAHPLGDLLDLLATQIGAYEAQQPPMAEATPREVLRSLMQEHGLTQTDLAQDMGGQAAPDSLASWHSRCAIHQDVPNFLEPRLPCLELLGYLLQKADRPSVIISFSALCSHGNART